MKRLLCLVLVLLMTLSLAPGVAETLQQATDQLIMDGNYTKAMEAVEQILMADPNNDEAYALKARLRIMALQKANKALNDMISEDMDKVNDKVAYTDLVKSLYAQAGIDLVIPFKPDYASASEINAEGSRSENLSGILWPDGNRGGESAISGVFAAQGDWIYFADPHNKFTLWKMQISRGKKQLVLPEMAGSLNVNGDWIYYRAVQEGNALYKVRTDGSEKTLLTGDNCSNLCVKDEWIYYANANEGNMLYTIRIDGGERRSLGKQGILHFISDVYLYYSSLDERNLLRLHIWKENEETLIKKQWHIVPRLLGGRLYYVVDQKGMVIMNMNPDGSDKKEILRVDGKVYCYAILQNDFILSTRTIDKQEILLSYDLDTMKDPVQIFDASTEAFCVDSVGHLYCLNAEGLYLLDLSGNTVNRVE